MGEPSFMFFYKDQQPITFTRELLNIFCLVNQCQKKCPDQSLNISPYLLYLRWLLTRWPAARAPIRDSSPANTVPHTTRASCLALCPGFSGFGPWIPSIWKANLTINNFKKVYILQEINFGILYFKFNRKYT